MTETLNETNNKVKYRRKDMINLPVVLFVDVRPGAGDINVFDVAKHEMNNNKYQRISQVLLHFNVGNTTSWLFHKSMVGMHGIFFNSEEGKYCVGKVCNQETIAEIKGQHTD
ncbi:MAG: hypothetical protein HQM01_11000 [Magnetococcales bacterium]|nr:hypothetical protein [Magnetococcales bacterium]